MKPGYKTTEFWLTVLAICVNAISASGLIAAESSEGKTLTVVVAGLAAFGYTVSRGIAKLNG